ncbi:MAG TPA: DUF2309 domain-containing protein [Pirellulales bacterium]|nr:DUF2309 domain-containing protein [Pirellulales bacterium]
MSALPKEPLHEPSHGRDLSNLQAAIDHAAHLLPAQGPITVFIHHNTLHAFEHLPFHEAVRQASHVFRCHPYLSEDRYRDALRRGRIRFADLQEVLQRDLGAGANEPIPCFGTRLQLRLAMLQYPLRTGPTAELIWHVAEANALRRVTSEASAAVRARILAETRRWVLRDLRSSVDAHYDDPVSARPDRALSPGLADLLDRFSASAIETWTDEEWERFTVQALWRVCCDGVRNLPQFTVPVELPLRHRDLLFEATGVDADAPVHELLIRFCAAFIDQGLSHWQLPVRDRGFFFAFCALYRQPVGPPDRWRRGLRHELARLQDQGVTPLESIADSLHALGVDEHEWEAYLAATLLALRGWAGMLRQIELRSDRVVRPVPQGSLVEFLAVRLILDRFSLVHAARESLDYTGPLSLLRSVLERRIDRRWPPSDEQRAFLVFQLAQIVGLSPDVLHRLFKQGWGVILEEIETFTSIERQRIFHLAFEQQFTIQALDAIALHARERRGRPTNPAFQVSCCLDEREESFRRHLEEITPEVETFGAAGFYSVPMYYRGAADAHFTALCPVVIRPEHWVTEEVSNEQGETHRRRAKTRRALGTASHRVHVSSRSFALGALLTGSLGVLASIPLTARILFPRLAARMRHHASSLVRTPLATTLHLERQNTTAGSENGGIGFTLGEMTDIGERLLRDIGLTEGFSRLVMFLGHGSNSLNNPHNSAYNCGACGGAAGGPNGRAIAEILNDLRVRQGLLARGLHIPSDTVFVGGSHNTCNDSVEFYDLDQLPATHRDEFEHARRAIAEACQRNAHERCRRFLSAPLTMSFAEAREHVEERSEDLAQTRPELGHATNAIIIVGRRELTRGLFLDRRSFLTSYDPTQDDANHTILTRVLNAIFPVCAGINLEYYFSNVDNVGFGCGTKLPHNLAGLLGVMDGAASDLRTGLPWQMVELHEPIRAVFVVETTPEAMLSILDRNPPIGQLCRNGWVQLAVVDPASHVIWYFQNGDFERYAPRATALPQALSSVEWYRGWRDHLEFAEIES